MQEVQEVLVEKYVLEISGCEMDSSGPGQGHRAGCYKHSNEPFDSVKAGDFLTS
jgi:hypothetical protein